jgi:hypothetical protein
MPSRTAAMDCILGKLLWLKESSASARVESLPDEAQDY